uniref:uncharacterized protein LOC101954299 isoform X1 n=1 Tax=Ictidomys tridecemlineatus TaxID=43179 RepID=UPI001A9F2FF9|nr:uncharacterized protein LOC101954299 isoform X1 [Ictidomys tridecemlineatus]
MSLTGLPTREKMKRYPVVASASTSPLEENILWDDSEKAWLAKGSRWETEGILGALTCPSPVIKHGSEPCLCGCSLRPRVVLYPRPPPAVRPTYQVLPSLSSGRRLPSPPVILLKSQLSYNLPKPKAKAKTQLLSWRSATQLRKLVPTDMWPNEFSDPLFRSLPEESLNTSMYVEESHIPSMGTISPVVSFVEGDNSSLPPLFK